MESNRSGSEVERKFQRGTAFVRHRLWVGVWVLVEPEVSPHGHNGSWVVDIGHNAKFSFALHAGSSHRTIDATPANLTCVRTKQSIKNYSEINLQVVATAGRKLRS